MSSAAADTIRRCRRSGAGPEALAPHQLSEQMPPAWSAGAAAMQQAGVKTAAVSEVQVRDEHEMDLERPSPQLTGEFNSNDAARAQTLDPHRERLILVGVVLFDHWQTATASEVQVRSEHEMHLQS